jgi:Protein of unknown function (DUF3501)
METLMLVAKRSFSPADLIPVAEYPARRVEARKAITALKKNRRVEVGPIATFFFENFETIRHQIQEMLHIEKGGEAQLADEIEAYAPLIPQGNELVATVMFEVDDEIRRRVLLLKIGGIENHAFVKIGDEVVRGTPDPHRENTSPEGKASSVQFFNFRMTQAQADAFRDTRNQVLIGFDHPNYGHIALLPDAVRAALALDL